jgi:hypothetical protein
MNLHVVLDPLRAKINTRTVANNLPYRIIYLLISLLALLYMCTYLAITV